MNANHIYNTFETTKKSGANDLTIGLAMYKAEHPEVEITHEEDREIREFMGRHYDKLVEAFATGDQEHFAKVVADCEAADNEAAGCDGGVCDIPEE